MGVGGHGVAGGGEALTTPLPTLGEGRMVKVLPADKDLFGVAHRAGELRGWMEAGKPGVAPLRMGELGQRGDVEMAVAEPDRVTDAQMHVVGEVADDGAGVVAAGHAVPARPVGAPVGRGGDQAQARCGVVSGVRAPQRGHCLAEGEGAAAGDGCQAPQGGGVEQGVVGVWAGARCGPAMCLSRATGSRLLAVARRAR
jgi:hypothetical protein